MTPFEKCCMIAYRCHDLGVVEFDGQDPLVLDIDIEDPYVFLSGELGFVDFTHEDQIMCPEDWPSPPYPECVCGDSVAGGKHYVLQWGDADDDIDEEDWAEWQVALHPECLLSFFEFIYGTEEEWFWDREEWEATRDIPPDYLYRVSPL